MKANNILIVDDELSMREFLSIFLEREGYIVKTAENAEVALTLLNKSKFDLVISDVNMPGLDGIALLERIKKEFPDTAVLMVTAFSTTEQAVEAMKHGAYDYISKPFKVEEIKILVKNAIEKQKLVRENSALKQQVVQNNSFSGIVAKSEKMQNIFNIISKVAGTLSNILIYGESGTGKELVAKAIHFNSSRKERPFVPVNCGAIPETLMESEFFGYVKGAFTGAVSDKPGFFEQAEGGTLFLDEIGELPLLLQTKLLRVIQERELRRIGGKEIKKIDVRIVAATNRDLEAQVAEGAFREDLFFRLNVVSINIPNLSERPEDIPLLVDYFYTKFSGNKTAANIIDKDALKILMNYRFPGNVRELENIIERALVLGSGEITVDSLPDKLITGKTKAPVSGSDINIPPEGVLLEDYLNDIERRFLLKSLEISGGKKKKAAELLGMTFRSFRYRLEKFGLDAGEDE
ncbi:MAG: sigma-54 dependent transcriptional regulator [Desulfuromonadales bacterium]|nr:sigma-54 dependent transcriptional regulator [Desulfuromonadales bacterium]